MIAMNTESEREQNMTKIIVILGAILVGLIVLCGILTNKYGNGNGEVIIYYKGYQTPYIRYRYDTEPWGNIKGDAMEANTDGGTFAEYTHKAVIPLKKYKNIITMFNDGNGNSDNNGGEYYKFESGTYLFDDGFVTKLGKKDNFQIAKFVLDRQKGHTGEKVRLKIGTIHGKGPFLYKMSVFNSAGEETVIQEYSSNNIAEWTPLEPGEYTFEAMAKDSKGAVSKKKIQGFTVSSLAITDIKTSVASPQEVETNIALSMEYENTSNEEVKCYYVISKGDSSQTIEATTSGAADWKPTEEGTYTIVGYLECGDFKVEKTIEYVIEETEAELTKLIIYYKGIDRPNVYYKDVNSTDDFKSEEMDEDSTIDGYKYRAELDVELGKQFVVYFSDGLATVDNNNGQNYCLQAGYFGIKDNQIVNLSVGEDEYEEYEEDYEEDYSEQNQNQEEQNGNFWNNNNGFDWNHWFN